MNITYVDFLKSYRELNRLKITSNYNHDLQLNMDLITKNKLSVRFLSSDMCATLALLPGESMPVFTLGKKPAHLLQVSLLIWARRRFHKD